MNDQENKLSQLHTLSEAAQLNHALLLRATNDEQLRNEVLWSRVPSLLHRAQQRLLKQWKSQRGFRGPGIPMGRLAPFLRSILR